jgi:thiol-disulfide isomerase/thioredoxin
MARPFFNSPTLIAIVAGLCGGLIVANYFRTSSEPEIYNLNAPTAQSVVTVLPEITLPDLSGNVRSVSEWYGRPLIVNFWATWCAPCRREMPILQLTHDAAGAVGPIVIGIAVDRSDDALTYVTESGYTYPMLVGQQEALDITELFGFDFLGLPFTVFTTATGEILTVHVGELHAEQLAIYLNIYKRLENQEIKIDSARQQMAAVHQTQDPA